jgi:hypothetical protein
MLHTMVIGLCLSLTLWLAGTISSRPVMRRIRAWALAALAGYGLAYGLALILVSVRPIWVTNGTEVWAEFPEQFAWALVATAWTQFIGVPVALAGLALYRRLRRP